MSSRHLSCERILGFFGKRTGHTREKIGLAFWKEFKRIQEWFHDREILIQVWKGLQLLWSQSKTRGARKTISGIITNTVATSVKEGVFLCISLLVFVIFLSITNQFHSLGVVLWSRCGPNYIKNSRVIYSFFQFFYNTYRIVITFWKYC